jgi:hypothetical protein
LLPLALLHFIANTDKWVYYPAGAISQLVVQCIC